MKLLVLSGVVAIVATAIAVEFEIRNNLASSIWIGIQGNSGKPALENGGFVLDSTKIRTISSPDNWAGRFWARTFCDSNTNKCQTGDCGNKLQCNGNDGQPPVTLVEITLRGTGGNDYYDISLVDGYNVRVKVEPVYGRGNCQPVKCDKQINDICPNELKLTGGGSWPETVACYSSCSKFNTDQYCCRGQFSTASTCNPNDWAVNSAKVFKDNCPDAYSYAFDDTPSKFSCVADKYKITFGP